MFLECLLMFLSLFCRSEKTTNGENYLEVRLQVVVGYDRWFEHYRLIVDFPVSGSVRFAAVNSFSFTGITADNFFSFVRSLRKCLGNTKIFEI